MIRNSVKKKKELYVTGFDFNHVSAEMLKLLEEKKIHPSEPTSDYF